MGKVRDHGTELGGEDGTKGRGNPVANPLPLPHKNFPITLKRESGPVIKQIDAVCQTV